jgi:uncharacterized membrane protein YkoI
MIVRLTLPLALTGALLAGCGGEDEPAAAPVPSTAETEVEDDPVVDAPPSAAPATQASAPQAPAAGGSEVTEAEARAIALKAAGSGAQVREFEEGEEDGRQVFKYDLVVGGTKREIVVERSTGKIVKNEIDD